MRVERLLRQHADNPDRFRRHVRCGAVDHLSRHQQRALKTLGDVDAELRRHENDPRIRVPKRTDLGWTLDFAHNASWLNLGMLALSVAVAAAIGCLQGSCPITKGWRSGICCVAGSSSGTQSYVGARRRLESQTHRVSTRLSRATTRAHGNGSAAANAKVR